MLTINFNQATYIGSAHHAAQWPADTGAEVAFAGRSNVGKSSAINAIVAQGGLAKTSKTPGRTQQINFFALDSERRLVDLPGYGFAKAPQHLRQHWQQFVTAYMVERQCLRGLMLPMDIRRPLTELDLSMLDWCREIGLSVHVLLTKADKFKRARAAQALQQVTAALGQQASVQLFSAAHKQGVEAARAQLGTFLG